MSGTNTHTIPFSLIKEGNVYYLVTLEEPRNIGWCIKNKQIFAASYQMEGCNYFDKEELESLIFDNIGEKWVRLSLPHRIPHKKAFIEGYKKALSDFDVKYIPSIVQVESELVNTYSLLGYAPKVVNGKVKIVSVK